MARRLLDQQASLLEFLTSRGAIFGECADTPLHPTLHGIDRGLLQLEARLSHDKRMERIVSVFPRTFELLGDGQAALVGEFIALRPSTSIERLANARQFYDFMSARWQLEPPRIPHICDVAACEFAFETARSDIEHERSEPQAAEEGLGYRVRRYPGVVLLRCHYDIRPIFEDVMQDLTPVARELPLAVRLLPGSVQPSVFEVRPFVFDLLTALDRWTDPAVFGDSAGVQNLIAQLAEQRLVEVRR